MAVKFSRIVLFGAGNLAVHLAKAIHSAGYPIAQVFSRTAANAISLANEVNAQAITNPEEFDHSADIIIFALNDSVLQQVASKINFSGQLVLHTSGSIPMDVFKDRADNFGVLYPLQTFSKFRPVKFHEVPLFIEANSAKNLANLKMLASSITVNVHLADSFQRKQVHLAAVFANNFVNHLYTLANEQIKKTSFSFDIIKPIILETALKAIESGNPFISQTGPAIRQNKEIIEKHLEMLISDPEMQKLYTFVSNSISWLHYNDFII